MPKRRIELVLRMRVRRLGSACHTGRESRKARSGKTGNADSRPMPARAIRPARGWPPAPHRDTVPARVRETDHA